MHYFISAGEPSGDLHGAELIKELRKADPDARFTILGGDLMAQASGHIPVIHYRDMAFMGFSEVLRNLRKILGNMRRARKAIASSHPDAFIAVDYPGFNLKLASFASGRSIPVYYYISPKVWAWKEWRVKQLRRYVRKILSILPFETDYFAKRGVDATYVGNPSVEEIRARIDAAEPKAQFLDSHGLTSSRPVLALVPGSRRGEIRCNLPVMTEVARRHPDMQSIIAGAPGIDADIYTAITDIPVSYGMTTAIMKHADAALVTSGTATLECALAGTPQVACYRANGMKISYNIMKRLIKCPFVTLPNLIAGRRVIPEMLVHQCTPEAVSRELQHILPGQPGRERQLQGYRLITERLGNTPAATTAARIIYKDLTAR
ncbi:MAG: lipid-A-disaccharide synthase [Muribaculaceae bacterium]|nr:lipid-A-disaccharide synthase [Muribaculaceae bacterium]